MAGGGPARYPTRRGHRGGLGQPADAVKNERRQRYDNQPYGTAFERILAHAYPEGHPYHHPTIGSMEDLDAADLDYVLSFHKTHYGPITSCRVWSALWTPRTSTVGSKRTSVDPPRETVAEAPDASLEGLLGSKSLVVEEQVPAPAVFIVHRIPPYGTREFDILHLASAVLGQGQGSRLYRRLVVERGLANDDGGASSDLFDFRYTQSLFFISMIARDGVSGSELENAIFEETAALADGISEEELERARAVLERDHFQGISTPAGLANALSGYTQLFDDPELVYTWPMRWGLHHPGRGGGLRQAVPHPGEPVLAPLRGRSQRDRQRLSQSRHRQSAHRPQTRESGESS